MVTIPAINMIRTGQNIADLRQRAGMSVRDLQAVFGFATPQAIYKWQHGAAMPTIDNLVVLAALFQVRIDDIIIMDGIEEDAAEETAAERSESEYGAFRFTAVCA